MSKFGTEWILQMRDMISKPLSEVKKNISSLKQSTDSYDKSIKTIPRSLNVLRENLKRLEAGQANAFRTDHIEKYRRMIAKTKQEIDKVKPPDMSKDMGKGLKSGGGLGGMLAFGGIAGAGLLAGAALKGRIGDDLTSLMDFEQSMSNVKAVTGAVGGEFDKLREKASQLGKDTAFSAAQVADGMAILGQMGFKTNEIIETIPQTLSLAQAGQLGLADAAEITASVMRQFGISAFNSERVVNVLASAASDSGTNISQMGEAMKYLGPTAHSMGMSLEETASIIGALSDGGIKGGMAGRALGTSLVNLARPTKVMEEAMQKLNFQAFDAKGNFVGMKNVLAQLEKGTSNMTAEQKQAAISMLFQNESFQEMNILLEKGSENFGKFSQSITGTNRAMEMAKIQTDNLRGDVERMGGAWDSFVQGLNGNKGVITNAFRGMTSAMEGFIEGLDKLNRGNFTVETEKFKGSTDKIVSDLVRKRMKNNLTAEPEMMKEIEAEQKRNPGISSKQAALNLINKKEESISARSKPIGIKESIIPFLEQTGRDADAKKINSEYYKLVGEQSLDIFKKEVLQNIFDKLPSKDEKKAPSMFNDNAGGGDALGKTEKGIGNVRGDGGTHYLTMNLTVNNKFEVDKNMNHQMNSIKEKITDIIVDAGRDAGVVLSK